MGEFQLDIDGLSYTYSDPLLATISYDPLSMGSKFTLHMAVSRSQSESVIIFTDRDKSIYESQINSYIETTSFSSDDIDVREVTSGTQIIETIQKSTFGSIFIECTHEYSFTKSVEKQLFSLSHMNNMYIFISSPFIPDRVHSLADSVFRITISKESTDKISTELSIPKNRYGKPLEESKKILFDGKLGVDSSYTVS
jgi:hypothetical protein